MIFANLSSDTHIMPGGSISTAAGILIVVGVVAIIALTIFIVWRSVRTSSRPEGQSSGASAFVITPGGLAPVGGTPVQQPDNADQLTKLAGLHDRGVLTDAEFEAEKQKLLGT